MDPEASLDQELGPQSLQRPASAMCIIKDLSLPSSLCLIAAAFVFVQCLQQAPAAAAAAATKAADAAADAPMAFSMSTGRSPRCHSAFEPCGEIKAYLIVIKMLTIGLGLYANGTFLKTRRKNNVTENG